MSELEWFVNFQFEALDILIAKKDISGSDYSRDIQFLFDIVAENGKIVILDDFMKKAFGIACSGKIATVVQLNAEFPFFVVSSVVPKIESWPGRNFFALPGMFGKKLAACGFESFHFAGGKMQCLLDFSKIDSA